MYPVWHDGRSGKETGVHTDPGFLNYSHFSPGVLNKLQIVVYVQSFATRNPFFRQARQDLM